VISVSASSYQICLVNAAQGRCSGAVGNMAEALEGEHVGVTLKSFDEAALDNGLEALLQLAADPATRAR